METTVIKLALAEDHAIMRAGLIQFLDADSSIKVIVEASDGSEMLQQLQQAKELPHIAIVDLSMPVMDGFTLSGELKSRYPAVRTLILSAYYSEYNVALTISKGVAGYLTKNVSPSELRKAIHSIYETGYYYSDFADHHAFRNFQFVKSEPIPEREMEFLKLCCTDLPYEDIARRMGISINTMHGCRQRLFDRLQVTSRVGVVLFAMQSGIISTAVYEPNHIRLKL